MMALSPSFVSYIETRLFTSREVNLNGQTPSQEFIARLNDPCSSNDNFSPSFIREFNRVMRDDVFALELLRLIQFYSDYTPTRMSPELRKHMRTVIEPRFYLEFERVMQQECSPPPVPLPFIIDFYAVDDWLNYVVDPTDVAEWNGVLGVTQGAFTSAVVNGSTIELYGANQTVITGTPFTAGTFVRGILDSSEQVIEMPDNSFWLSNITTIAMDGLLVVPINFANQTTLNSVSFAVCTWVKDSAFIDCTGLASANLPLLERVDQNAFHACPIPVIFPFLTIGAIDAFSATAGPIDCPLLVDAPDSMFVNCSASTANLPLLETAGDGCLRDTGLTGTLSLPKLRTTGSYCFQGAGVSNFQLPLLEDLGDTAMALCTSATTIYMPSLINLGPTTGDDSVFLAISGNTITLTVPTALSTCDAGSPDGDIVYLLANNPLSTINYV